MNKDNAKDYLPLVQALTDGKEIEYRSVDGWTPVRHPSFNESADRYRIKPEPKWRPWRESEIPVGATFRTELGNEFLILARVGNEVCMASSTLVEIRPYGIKIFTQDCSYFTDFGTTWKPCGVEEDHE
jgi:hypothetical protein